MNTFVKSPFNFSSMEKDPMVYGLRPDIIKQSITELLNDNSLLITGSRGIGKSSLAYQLQRILKGDSTVLNRCGINADFKNYTTINYTCQSYDTLKTIVLNLIKKFEKIIKDDVKIHKICLKSVEINFFNIAKTNLEVSKSDSTEYVSIADEFIKVIEEINNIYITPHINIVIDELDKLDERYNIAHFTKAVFEELDSDDFNYLSFIFVGQENLFDKLYNQQPSFARQFKHINLLPLNDENSDYVIDACLNRCGIYTQIDIDAKNLLLGMSGGYPYSIQLIGHESFNCMIERYETIDSDGCQFLFDDVLSGLKNAIISEKVKFNTIYGKLTELEKNYLSILICKKQEKLPFEYNLQFILDGVALEDSENKTEEAIKMIKSLIDKQILIFVTKSPTLSWNEKKFKFKEELFRVYLVDSLYQEEPFDYE